MRFYVRGLNREKYKNNIFQLFLLMTIIPVIILGGVLYQTYLNEITAQVDMSLELTETQVSNDVESILEGIRQYYTEIKNQEEVTWLVETKEIPYKEYSYLYNAQKVLRGPIYLNGYIQSYAFLNQKYDWLLTNNGMFKLSEMKNNEQFSEFFEKIKTNPSNLYWFNNMEGESPYRDGLFESNKLDVSGYRLIVKLSGISNRLNQLLLVQINTSSLSQNLSRNLGNYDLCILNREGEFLYSSDTNLQKYCRENLDQLKDQKEIRAISLNPELDYRIRVSDKAGNELIYVTAYNMDGVKEGAGKILIISMIVVLIFLILLFICWKLTMVLYRPVQNLTTYVSEMTGKAEQGDNEFTYIRDNVGQLIHAKENLQQMVRNQQSLLMEQFMLKMARGELSNDKIKSAMEQFHLKKMNYYHLMAVICMRDMETYDENDFETEALSMVIVKQIPLEICNQLVSNPFCENEVVYFLVGADEILELKKKTIIIHEAIIQYIDSAFGCPIISGISKEFNRLKYLRVAYYECREALRNAESMQLDRRELTFYDYIAQQDNLLNGYDFSIEQSLIVAVNNGLSDEAAQLVDKFVNSLNNRSITRHDRNYFLHRMVVSVLSVLSDAGFSQNQVFSGRSDDIFLQLSSTYESDRLKHYMNSHIVQPVIEALKQFRYEESSEILKNIVDLVEETKGDITLAECSEQLNYHPSYIWKVLKAEKNITFTDLVNQEKIKTAKHMLLHTNFSVSEIAEQLGYSNTQNFIRFFSKYLDITPGKYRKENK